MKKLLYGPVIPDLWDGVKRCKTSEIGTSACKQGLGDISNLVFNVIRISLFFASTIALLYFIYNAIRYLTSAGSPDTAAQAKSGMLYSVLGFILIILSYSIITFFIGIW